MIGLTKPVWMDLGGTPASGGTTPHVSVVQGKVTPQIVSEVASLYGRFCNAKRVSLAKYHVLDRPLRGGGRVRIVSNSGADSVTVWCTSPGDDDEKDKYIIGYPAILNCPYMPIFNRYVFDRSNPAPVLPDLPIPPDPLVVIPYPPQPAAANNFQSLFIYEEHSGPGTVIKKVLYLIEGTTNPGESAPPPGKSYEDWVGEGLINNGIEKLVDGGLTSSGSPPIGQDPIIFSVMTGYHRWGIIGSGRVVTEFPEDSGEYITEYWYDLSGTLIYRNAFRGGLADDIDAHNDALNGQIEANYNAWLADKEAIRIENEAAFDVWKDLQDAYDLQVAAIYAAYAIEFNEWQANPIDARAELLALRRSGRAAQIDAFNERLDGGTANRHVTWAMFNAPMMVNTKHALAVNLTLGEGPLDIAGYVPDTKTYGAEYALSKMNRDTELGTGYGGDGDEN